MAKANTSSTLKITVTKTETGRKESLDKFRIEEIHGASTLLANFNKRRGGKDILIRKRLNRYASRTEKYFLGAGIKVSVDISGEGWSC